MSSPAQTRSRFGMKLALLLFTVALIFALAEGVSWLIWQQQLARLEAFAAELEARKNEPRGEWDDLPDLKGMFAVATPNVRGKTAGVLFENNQYGFRGPDRPIEKPPGTFRIAVIGDSVTMGFGVLYEETYAGRLEASLAQARPDMPIEVLNVGLSGLETRAVVQRLEDKALRFDPDLVIYGFTLNDIEGEHYRRNFEGRDRNNKRFLESPLHFWRVFGARIYGFLDIVFGPPGSYQFELRENYFENPAALGAMLEGLDRLRALAESRGNCTVLLLHTRLESLDLLHPYHDFYDLIADAGESRDFFVARSYSAFDGLEATDLWVTPFDAHPNGEGHRRLEGVLLERLQSLPDRCWRGAG